MYFCFFARAKAISALILISVVLSACGGGVASDAVPPTKDPVAETPQKSSSSAISSVIAIKPSSAAVALSSKASIAASVAPSSTVSSSVAGVALSSKASGSATNIALSSKANSSVASVTLSSKAASSSLVSSKAASSIAGVLGATIEWAHPTARENGDYLELTEIGGYQIRYKAPTAAVFSYITIVGNGTTSYVFTQSIVGLQLQIAVYDSSGIYSDFVSIN